MSALNKYVIYERILKALDHWILLNYKGIENSK